MRPLADLLVGLCPKINAILYIPHIPDHNRLHIICLAELNRLTAGFVQDVSLLTIHLRASSGFTFLQPAMPFRSWFAVRDQSVQCGMALVAKSFDRAQCTTTNNQSISCLCDNCGNADFTQVHTCYLTTLFRGWIYHSSIDGQA